MPFKNRYEMPKTALFLSFIYEAAHDLPPSPPPFTSFMKALPIIFHFRKFQYRREKGRMYVCNDFNYLLSRPNFVSLILATIALFVGIYLFFSLFRILGIGLDQA